MNTRVLQIYFVSFFFLISMNSVVLGSDTEEDACGFGEVAQNDIEKLRFDSIKKDLQDIKDTSKKEYLKKIYRDHALNKALQKKTNSNKKSCFSLSWISCCSSKNNDDEHV